MSELKFRPLKADEIECRVASISSNGLQLLLYKDARVDMNLLDETVGAMNWQKHYQTIDGQLFCTISIWDEDKGQWISKQDVGVESNTEAEKGRASDAQKRAAFAFGIGRQLYTAPFVWIPAELTTIEKDERGKYKCKDRFSVSRMEVENGCITKLEIKNQKNVLVFSTIAKVKAEPKKETPKAEPKKEETVPFTDVLTFCQNCGDPIADYTTKAGKIVPAEEIAKKSFNACGMHLCFKCSKKLLAKDDH